MVAWKPTLILSKFQNYFDFCSNKHIWFQRVYAFVKCLNSKRYERRSIVGSSVGHVWKCWKLINRSGVLIILSKRDLNSSLLQNSFRLYNGKGFFKLGVHWLHFCSLLSLNYNCKIEFFKITAVNRELLSVYTRFGNCLKLFVDDDLNSAFDSNAPQHRIQEKYDYCLFSLSQSENISLFVTDDIFEHGFHSLCWFEYKTVISRIQVYDSTKTWSWVEVAVIYLNKRKIVNQK